MRKKICMNDYYEPSQIIGFGSVSSSGGEEDGFYVFDAYENPWTREKQKMGFEMKMQQQAKVPK